MREILKSGDWEAFCSLVESEALTLHAMMMTSLLLAYYLFFIRKIKIGWIALMLTVFALIEVSFFMANIVKIKS